MVEEAKRLGIKVTDDEGNYTGLTHDTILAIMRERHELKFAVGKLRWWLSQNTTLPSVADQTDVETVETARAIMETVKTAATAVWPVLVTMWGNVAHTLQKAGVIPADRPAYGDITLEDRVEKRPK